MTKTPAGQPKVKVSNGRLQIVLTYREKRKYLSLGVSDSKHNRKFAETVRAWIENDLRAATFNPTIFDPTLAKYKRSSSTEPDLPLAEDITISQLWERYTDYKRPQLSQTTIAKDFERVRLNINKLPSVDLADAIVIRDYLLRNTSPNTAKRVLAKLSSACSWGVISKLIGDNPFAGMSADIANPKSNEDEDINAFSPEERDRIIQSFKDANSHYAPLVEFLFRTGSRPSEAIAVQFKHIGKDYRSITFCQAITRSEDGLKLKPKLKTQSQRVFPCGEGMAKFLELLTGDLKDRDRFLFTSTAKKFVNIDKLTGGEWQSTLKNLGIEHRGIYHCRHTYITFCLDSGMDAKDVAKLVGNSPEMIYKHYASSQKNLIAPDF